MRSAILGRLGLVAFVLVAACGQSAEERLASDYCSAHEAIVSDDPSMFELNYELVAKTSRAQAYGVDLRRAMVLAEDRCSEAIEEVERWARSIRDAVEKAADQACEDWDEDIDIEVCGD